MNQNTNSEAALDHELSIKTNGLTKQYGKRRAVDNLSLAVPKGVIAGFVGPNGAGKTTTLRMLLGLVKPSRGTGNVLGSSLERPKAYLHKVGALIEGPAFYPTLSGYDNLKVQAILGNHDVSTIPSLLQQVGLGSRGGDRYKTYSLGMRQRLGIAAALLGDPQLLILDEPANGLDPAGIRDMRELLRSIGKDDRTVLVSSHLLAEVQQICDWLIVIDQGKQVFQGKTEDLLATGVKHVVIHCATVSDVRRLEIVLKEHHLSIETQGLDTSLSANDLRQAFSTKDDPSALAALSQEVLDRHIKFTGLGIENTKLEDRYRALTEGIHNL